VKRSTDSCVDLFVLFLLFLRLRKAVYHACSAQVVFSTTKSSGLLEMQHRGTHGHARPPPARAPPSASLAFAQSVLAAPSRSPKALFSSSFVSSSSSSSASSSSGGDGGGGGETKELHPAIGKSLTTVRNKRQCVLRAAFSVAQLKTSKAWAGRGVTVVGDDEGREAIAFTLEASASSPSSASVSSGSPLATELVPLLPGTDAAAAAGTAPTKSLLVTVAFSAERLRFVPVGMTLLLLPDEKKPTAAQLEAHVKRLPSLTAGPEQHGMLYLASAGLAEVKSTVSSFSLASRFCLLFLNKMWLLLSIDVSRALSQTSCLS
jgi:hypothetical protein